MMKINGLDLWDYFELLSKKVDFIIGFDTAGQIRGFESTVKFPFYVYVREFSPILEKEGYFVQRIANSLDSIPFTTLKKWNFKFTTEERTLVDMVRKYVEDDNFYSSTLFEIFEYYYDCYHSFQKLEIPEDIKDEVSDVINEVIYCREVYDK